MIFFSSMEFNGDKRLRVRHKSRDFWPVYLHVDYIKYHRCRSAASAHMCVIKAISIFITLTDKKNYNSSHKNGVCATLSILNKICTLFAKNNANIADIGERRCANILKLSHLIAIQK